MKLKKLSNQVIVLTGATSGIGLVTARQAAKRGARLVLAARNAEALDELRQELNAERECAVCVAADVGKEEDVRRIAQAALEHFGGFDTWINNAGVSIFGRIEDVPLEDQRRLFDTNFWGVVHGSVLATKHLKQCGGALINIGSVTSDQAIPLQGIYSASKHAVKGFTDALRIELEEERAPISVTLIKPSSIDTLFVPHAKNHMDVQAKLPSPVYAPEIVADAILFAAEHPKRDIHVGAPAKMASVMAKASPRLMDHLLRRFVFKQQRTGRPARQQSLDSLYQPSIDMMEREGQRGHVWESSLATKASLHPKTAGMLLAGAGLLLTALWRRSASRAR
jgi:short-subunit dehydrogenase